MACPFPGMDPFLEGSPYWQGFHNSLMNYLRDTMQPLLPANYVATLEVRIYVESEGAGTRASERIPDVEVIRTGPGRTRGGEGGVAVAAAPVARGFWIEDALVERREAFVNVRAMPGQELVTSIELLSPTNKRGGEGQRAYKQKQLEVIQGGANLVEIDLLRGGAHTLAVNRQSLGRLPQFDYLICVFRAAWSWGYQVLPWTLCEPLPLLPVPLGPEDAELEIDLQPLFAQAYENGAFHRLLDYRAAPDPALREEDVPWAAELVSAGPASGG